MFAAAIPMALMAVAGVATIGKMAMESRAASAQDSALDLQAKQNEIQYNQKTLSNIDTMQKIMAAQEAALSTRGVAFSSPSFNALQRETFNTSGREQAVLDTQEAIAQSNVDIEKKMVKDRLRASLFGDVASFGTSMASYGMSTPKLPTRS